MNLEILFLSLLKEHTLVICGFGAIVTSGLILLDQEDLDLNMFTSGGVNLSQKKGMTVFLY